MVNFRLEDDETVSESESLWRNSSFFSRNEGQVTLTYHQHH